MTVLVPHVDDEALFFGEIINNCDTIILISDCCGDKSWKQVYPNYGKERIDFLKHLYYRANIIELGLPDEQELEQNEVLKIATDLKIFKDKITFCCNPHGHINHRQTYWVGVLLNATYTYWCYNDSLLAINTPLDGKDVSASTQKSMIRKNFLIREYSNWFKTNYPQKWNPFFDSQLNKPDVISKNK